MRHDKKSPIQLFIIIVGTPIKAKKIIVFFDYIKYKI